MMRNGGNELREALEGAVNAAQKQAAVEKALGGGGTLFGWVAAVFLVPAIAMYAWNNLTPESVANWEYLPVVAAFFVVRILIGWVRGQG